MRRTCQCFLLVLSFILAMPASNLAQDKTPANSSVPASGARAEFLERLDFYQSRYVGLAQAIPQEKYIWRPGEGVRSISEVFLHVAAANFNLPHLVGTDPPAGFDARTYDKSTTDKAKIIQALKDSFAHYREAVLKLNDVDLEKTVKLFGKDHSYRFVFLFSTGHLGEHLGQAIAYARMNGVVPPWTEEQQQKSAAKPKS